MFILLSFKSINYLTFKWQCTQKEKTGDRIFFVFKLFIENDVPVLGGGGGCASGEVFGGRGYIFFSVSPYR